MAKGKRTGQMVRIAAVGGGAVAERIAISYAPPAYRQIGELAAVAVGAGLAMYMPGTVGDVGTGVAAGGAIGLVGTLLGPAASRAAAGTVGSAPRLQAAQFDETTGRYARTALPAEYRVISGT